MHGFLLIIFLIVAITLIILIMIQQDNGADMGISFSRVSNLFFSSSGLDTFLTRSTKILAALFFIISLALCNINKNKSSNKKSEWMNLTAQTETTEQIHTDILNETNDIPQ